MQNPGSCVSVRAHSGHLCCCTDFSNSPSLMWITKADLHLALSYTCGDKSHFHLVQIHSTYRAMCHVSIITAIYSMMPPYMNTHIICFSFSSCPTNEDHGVSYIAAGKCIFRKKMKSLTFDLMLHDRVNSLLNTSTHFPQFILQKITLGLKNLLNI